MTLPDLEIVAEKVHDAWVQHQRERGVTSSISRHTGEEQMAPYAQLSETVKESDRRTVRAVYAAIQECEP